jgi:pyridoxamine 5'-phosphate oxidase
MTEESATDWPDPMERFAEVYRRAAEHAPFDHTATTLATSSTSGRPSARIVLLKGHSRHGFVFFSNYFSRKGKELLENPYAALCFYWPWLKEQVRAEGKIEQLPASDSDAYFSTRPRISQIGAWASRQSLPLESRDALLERVQQFEVMYADRAIPRPENWGGYLLIPNVIEFWKDGQYRLHDRFVYARNTDKTWTVRRLNP